MSYPYGTQGAPAVGAGAPGLPQRSSSVLGADSTGAPAQRLIVRATDLYATTPFITPDWATYCRATAVGKGGQGLGGLYGAAVGGTGASGGGGAGLAASNVEVAPAGTPLSISFTSAATLVSFLGYQLSGGNGGDASTTVGGSGGVGTGGAINFNGGAGGTVGGSTQGGGGGGAAGRGGVGSSAASTTPGSGGLGDQYATGGGAGGASTSSSGTTTGAYSRTDASFINAAFLGQSTANQAATGSAAVNSNGGDGGGGSGGVYSGTISNLPGAALVLIELW